jgi:hypothetical protein
MLMLLLCRGAIQDFALAAWKEGRLTSEAQGVLDEVLGLLEVGSGSTLVQEEVVALEKQLGKLAVIGGEPEHVDSDESGHFACRCDQHMSLAA